MWEDIQNRFLIFIFNVMFIGKKNDHIWKKALWFQVEELINPSKFSQILTAKKGGNYRLDRCFASNTSEDMLQPINK